jgi:isocitrate dehydrogenase
MNNKSPSRKVGEHDNRASHYWIARYWAEALAAQTNDAELAERFAPIAASLQESESRVLAELLECQGSPQDIGGYYQPNEAKAVSAMRPSVTFNALIGEACPQPTG